MKIRGREISGPNRVTLVLPREEDEDIVIIAEAISDMSAFDQFMDMPKPPAVQKPGGNIEHNFSDPGFVEQLAQYNLKKMAWIVLKSLTPSEIEWDKVDLDNPGSWIGYQEEMRDAGFSDIEINRVCNLVMEANALDESKLEAARQSFLRGQAEA
jgi:hypothetical protein